MAESDPVGLTTLRELLPVDALNAQRDERFFTKVLFSNVVGAANRDNAEASKNAYEADWAEQEAKHNIASEVSKTEQLGIGGKLSDAFPMPVLGKGTVLKIENA